MLACCVVGVCSGGAAWAQWSFTDVTASAGLTHVHGWAAPTDSEPEAFCAGVAAGDYDRDGWPDLYVVRGDAGANLLYRNRGDGTFENVATAAGVDLTMRGCGATFADYDGDGWLDLLVLAIDFGGARLFRNLGDGTFADVTTAAGLALTRENNVSAAFGDYDRDGDLDLFVTHWAGGKIVSGPVDQHLWVNDGDGTFTHAGPSSGIVIPTEWPQTDFTFTPAFSDVDDDGWPDVLVAADFVQSQVFRNASDGTFTDATDQATISDQNGMGAAICDYDHDGDLDWFVTSIWRPSLGKDGNRLYRNDGGPLATAFTDVTSAAGVRVGDWGWGATCQDFDNDGHPDLFHVNGWPALLSSYPESETDPAHLFVSNGDGTFDDEASLRGIADTGRGLGVVAFDYDRDGDLDVFLTNNQAAPALYRNDGGNAQHWLRVRLAGRAPNTEAVGSRVRVTAGGVTQTREIRVGSNFTSQDPAEAHFGLGSATTVDSVVVEWLAGGSTTVTTVGADQVLVLAEPVGTCGDGVLDTGEGCDVGAQNGVPASCCRIDCRLRAVTFACRPAAGSCDVPETCSGVSPACPADVLLPTGTTCRPSAGVCDVAETCDGTDGACPDDVKRTDECRSAVGPCDVPEICDGSDDACPADGFASVATICRLSAGACDEAETCPGTSASCPADGKRSDECRAAAGPCDVAESCDGFSNACPADAFLAGDTCRPEAGPCDVAEACLGTGPACPADVFASPSTPCRAAVDVCDAAETCTGSSIVCPFDGKRVDVCRPAVDLCDVPESCDGFSDACPADAFANATTICRAAVAPCDLAEHCTGGSSGCPADGLVPAGTECRAAVGLCDLPETCSGVDLDCPENVIAPAGEVCRPAASVCDVEEACTGASPLCPIDQVSPAGVECRATAGPCDERETCDGANGTCPADALAAAGTICRASVGACDVAEACGGTTVSCPPDGVAPPGTVCRPPSDACDLVESCDGFSTGCPVDTGTPDGDLDGTCDVLDVCPSLPDPEQIDTDLDGRGDACDPCTALQSSVSSNARLKLTSLAKPLGNHRLSLKMTTRLAAPIAPGVDPTANGLGLDIVAADEPATVVLHATVPAGAYDSATAEGWRTSASGAKHVFRSRAGVAGITKAIVKRSIAVAGELAIIVKAKAGAFVVGEADLPLAVTVTVNGTAGQCGDFVYGPSTTTACMTRGSGTIVCR